VPIAVNCFVVPMVMLEFVGLTAMDTSAADVTVSSADPDTFVVGSVAFIVIEPAAAVVARPLEPTVLLNVAIDSDDEDQFTEAVRSFFVLLAYIPVAVNCCVVPFAMLELAGVTEIETSELVIFRFADDVHEEMKMLMTQKSMN